MGGNMKSATSIALKLPNCSKVAVLLSSSICRILLSVLVFFLLIELTALPSVAVVRQEEGFINFPLEVDVDAKGNKRWIILPLDDESQVVVGDDEARAIIFRVVNGLFNGRYSPEIQKSKNIIFSVLIDMLNVSLPEEALKKNLEISMHDSRESQFDTVDGSIEIGAKDTLKVPISITIAGPPIKSLNIILKIGDYGGQFYPTRLGTLGELTKGVISEPLEAKTVLSVSDSIGLTESEIDKLKAQLVRIAVEALNHAKAEPYGMVFGATPPVFGKADPDLDKSFRFPGSKNVTLYIKESDSQEFSHELILGLLKAVRKIEIENTNNSYKKTAKELLKELRGTLPRIWTADFYSELEERLHDDKRVISLGKTSIKNGIYLIKPYLGGRMFEGGARVSAGIIYSSDKKLAGTASASVSNLSGKNEQTSIRAELGEEIQNANFKFSLPQPAFRRYNNKLKDSTFHLNAAYDRDKEQLYELVKADQELIKTGIGYSFVWDSLDSKQQGKWGQITQPDRKKSRFVTTVNLALDYENWHFRGQDPGTPILNGGQYGIAKLNFAEDMGFDFRHRQSRFQELNIPVWLEGQYGYGFNDNNDDYSQFRFAIQSKFYFRWLTEKDINLNLCFRGGISDIKTPVFKKFKVGSNDIVRGLESGEIITNSYSVQSIEMGVSLWSLLMPLLDGNSQNTSSPQKNESNSPQENKPNSAKEKKEKTAQEEKEEIEREQLIKTIKAIRLEIFYDRGSVSQEDRFFEMFKFGGDLQGYGINLSIKVPESSFEFKFGYAYSPDSETHSSGLFYTRIDSYIW
jgi:hypothetical protein